MFCKLCETFFVQETTFDSLYQFQTICPTCLKRFKPMIKHEVIPFSNGVVEYYYLYDAMQLNPSQQAYLTYQTHIILDRLRVNQRSPLICWLDHLNIDTFREESPWLAFQPCVVFMSLQRFNIEDFKIFY